MGKKFDIMRLPPQEHPVYFVIESRHPDAEVRDYVYEEADCPVNFFVNGVEEVFLGGDLDPHGMFEHVKTIDEETDLHWRTGGGEYDPKEEWSKIIPEAFPKKSS